MTELQRCAVADAPAPAVWNVLQEIGRLQDWSPSTIKVDGPRLLTRVGDRFVQTVQVAGRTFRSDWRVERFVPGRRISLSGQVLPRVHVEMDEVLSSVGDGTQVCLTMRYRLPFGPLGRLAGRLGLISRAGTEAEAVLARVVAEAEARAQASVPDP